MDYKEAKRLTKKALTNKGATLDLIKWIFALTKGVRRYIWAFLAISAASMGISLCTSVASKYAVDAATGYAGGVFYKYIIAMVITAVVSLILNAVSTRFNSYVSEKYSFTLKSEMFDRVQRGTWFDVSRFHSGDIIVRITDDISSIASNLITLIPSVIVASAQLVIVLYILLRYETTLALIGLVVGPTGFLASVLFRKKYTKYEKALKETDSEYHTFFQDVLSNVAITKVFQREDANNRTLEEIRDRRLDIVTKSSRVKVMMSSVMRIIYTGGYLLCFCYCAYLLSQNTTYENAGAIVKGTFTYGTMTLFLSLVSRVESSISSIGSMVPSLFSMMVCAKRIRDVSELEKEVYEPAETEPKSIGIKVNDLSFEYVDEITTLDRISFEIKPNRCVGLVGRSGTGKTTLVRLLLSLLKPNSGSITYIDENGNEEFASPASRRFISYVPQGNTLLSGTIRSNLAVSRENLSDDDMWNALRIADAEAFVRRLPDGLDTVLAEKAGGISEGQAQRIAIARAILRDKPLMIFDEATSALDEETEAKICEAISNEIDKTCIIITHRSSMLRYCDDVIRIGEDGKLCASALPPQQ